ncbi:hypothetical protein ANN_01005 [Periplaneta americana]|uniref:HTH psq-type domain-containing protein n=1 Tax=Periplaneta americana TaxID=6978 RepID=A0ABQ8TU58_PERAM|nr:hypothetical protein ANN_01005 [Periplaneta americana]
MTKREYEKSKPSALLKAVDEFRSGAVGLNECCRKYKIRKSIFKRYLMGKMKREYDIKKVQENRESFELNELHQLLVYADDVNMLRENSKTTRENTTILLKASGKIQVPWNNSKQMSRSEQNCMQRLPSKERGGSVVCRHRARNMPIFCVIIRCKSNGTEKNSLRRRDLNPGFQLYVLMLYPLSHTGYHPCVGQNRLRLSSNSWVPSTGRPLHYVIEVYEPSPDLVDLIVMGMRIRFREKKFAEVVKDLHEEDEWEDQRDVGETSLMDKILEAEQAIGLNLEVIDD